MRSHGVLVPLGVYLAVAIAFPAMNGAATRPDFAGHAANTLLVSGAVALCWTVLTRWSRSRRAPPRTHTSRS